MSLAVERAHGIAHDVEHERAYAVPRLAATVHTGLVSAVEAACDILAHHR
jgi:hypothetical protein